MIYGHGVEGETAAAAFFFVRFQTFSLENGSAAASFSPRPLSRVMLRY